MLAPRKKLWPTPPYVIEEALSLAGVTSDDVVLDLGCGDGRTLIAAAVQRGARGVGYEINVDRAAEAVSNVTAAGVGHLVDIRCGNALDADLDSIRPTVAILFLIERGLRIAAPMLATSPVPMRVCTYTYSIPKDCKFTGPRAAVLVKKHWCSDPVVADRKVPLYYYKFDDTPTSSGGTSSSTSTSGNNPASATELANENGPPNTIMPTTSSNNIISATPAADGNGNSS